MTYITNKDYFNEASYGRIAGVGVKVITATIFTQPTLSPISTDGDGVLTSTFPVGTETLTIVSTSVDDTLLGSGMRAIIIEGLDADFNQQFETINLDGTTPVVTSLAWKRFRVATGFKAGDDGWNVGNITLTGTTSSFEFGHMESFQSVTNSGIYTVRAGKQAKSVLLDTNVARSSAGAQAVVDTFIYTRDFLANSPWVLAFTARLDTSVATEISLETPISGILSEKTDVVMAYSSESTNLKLRMRLQLLEEPA